MSDPVLVTLRRMPQMLRDILERAIARQPDLQLVADTGSDDASPPAGYADVVVIGSGGDGGEPHAWPSYLHRWPAARVMTIDVSGRHTCLYELRPYCTEYEELSYAEIVDVMRSAVETGADLEQRPQVNAGRL